MVLILDFVSEFSKRNEGKFNSSIIKDCRCEDEIIDYLIDVCKALETIPYIKFLGHDMITDESKFKERNWKSIKDSRLSQIIFRFQIDYDNETCTMEMPIFVPKLLHNYYYILNGNKYYSIFQHVDSSTYNTKSACILKSLLMPIILKLEEKTITDVNKVNYDTRFFILNQFKHKMNIFNYYFPIYGVEGTLKYFGMSKNIQIVLLDTELDEIKKDNFIYFPINKEGLLLRVNKEHFDRYSYFRNVVSGVYNLLKKTDLSQIEDLNFWKVKLGEKFTTNKNLENILEKTNTVLLSFKRILDNRTRKNLKINEKDKKDIYTLIRWMCIDFEKLIKKDNLSLYNKRLRLIEYQINSFNKKMSTNTYRILNSKQINMTRLKSIFKISPTIIINDLQVSELMRYNNAVNDMDIFTTALKYSNRGPSACGEGGKKTIPVSFRGIHLSHLGKVSLNSVSAGDPGMTGHLTPFVKTDGLYYSK